MKIRKHFIAAIFRMFVIFVPNSSLVPFGLGAFFLALFYAALPLNERRNFEGRAWKKVI